MSIYVEQAYPGRPSPSESDTQAYAAAVVQELQYLGFIDEAAVVDLTWIGVAYTWSWRDSTWRAQALQRLEEHNIMMVDSYGW